MRLCRHRLAVAVATGAVGGILTMAGCGNGNDAAPTPTEEQGMARPDHPGSPAQRGPASPALDDLVGQAVADLAGRLGVGADDIRTDVAERVTWRDGSVGCPQPGMMYPQVLTPGARIVLEHAGTAYVYHAGGNRAPFLCENPEQPL